MSETRDFAKASKAWPFEEARELLEKRLKNKLPEKGFVLFETGYGPSGLPHIGTFGEVARTIMVKKAFSILMPDMKTKLYCFSDDMDGLRKVPDNVPNKELIEKHLGKPLTQIPDPFGTHESFGHHNNSRLKGFLDSFGFEYEFKSSTDCYKSGIFDKTLLAILNKYDEIINVVLPTLGDERKATYSPFLPICKKTGKVLQVPVVEVKKDSGTIIYKDEDGSLVETLVTGGNCKLQWKVDWAMRWTALDVDYEMSGKEKTEIKKDTKTPSLVLLEVNFETIKPFGGFNVALIGKAFSKSYEIAVTSASYAIVFMALVLPWLPLAIIVMWLLSIVFKHKVKIKTISQPARGKVSFGNNPVISVEAREKKEGFLGGLFAKKDSDNSKDED